MKTKISLMIDSDDLLSEIDNVVKDKIKNKARLAAQQAIDIEIEKIIETKIKNNINKILNTDSYYQNQGDKAYKEIITREICKSAYNIDIEKYIKDLIKSKDFITSIIAPYIDNKISAEIYFRMRELLNIIIRDDSITKTILESANIANKKDRV